MWKFFSGAGRNERIGIVFILAAGAALRLWHIGWGLPALYEEALPLHIATQFWNWNGAGGHFDPHFFNYPALSFYLIHALQGAVFGAGRLLGAFPDAASFITNLAPSVIAARAMNVAFDAGTIVVAWLIGRRIAGAPAGLIAAGCVAISPLSITQAHLISVDTPLTFFAAAALLFCALILENGTMKRFLLAGLFIGLAAGTKYTGAFLLIPLLAAYALSGKAAGFSRPPLSRPAAACAAAIGVFLMTNPYIVLSGEKFAHDLAFEQFHMSYGHLGIDMTQTTPAYYLLDALPGALGALLIAALLCGIVVAVRRRSLPAIVVLTFPLAALSVMSFWEMRAERYLLPLLPPLAVICGYGASAAWEFVLRRFPARLPSRAVALLALAAAALPLLAADRRYHATLALPDTRSEAAAWMAVHLPPGARVASGPVGIPFPRRVREVVAIPFSPTGTEALAPFYDARWYGDLDLVVASDVDKSRMEREPERFAPMLAYFDTLKERWNLVFSALPGEDRTGPALWLYAPPAHRPERDAAAFPDDLLRGLARVDDSSLVAGFADGLANALFAGGPRFKCAQLMRVAVAFAPDSMQLKVKGSYILYETHAFAEALAVADDILARRPGDYQIFFLKGLILTAMNRPEEAESAYLRSIGIQPSFAFPYDRLEELYERSRNREKLAGILKAHRRIISDGSDQARRIDSTLHTLEQPTRQ